MLSTRIGLRIRCCVIRRTTRCVRCRTGRKFVNWREPGSAQGRIYSTKSALWCSPAGRDESGTGQLKRASPVGHLPGITGRWSDHLPNTPSPLTTKLKAYVKASSPMLLIARQPTTPMETPVGSCNTIGEDVDCWAWRLNGWCAAACGYPLVQDFTRVLLGAMGAAQQKFMNSKRFTK